MKLSTIAEQIRIAAATSLEANSSHDPDIAGVAAVDEAVAGTLSYIEGDKFAQFVATTGATALILPQNKALQAQATERGIAWISTADPRLAFARAIALFYQPYRPAPGIHPSAVIDPTATYGKNVSIGANVVISAGVHLGNDVCIHPNVVIYPEVRVGDRTVLHANCTIQERSRIGADCTLHSGAVIGAEGFGFVPTAEGWEKMDQSGYVVIADGVRVGGNTCIDRPAVGVTRIGRDTKLDNLIQIAHGCQVGEAVVMASQVGMAGGVKVGNRVILAGQVGIANQATIGDGAIATAKAGIHNDIEPGEIVTGIPALPHKVFLKASAIYRRLPEMHKSLQKLQRALDALNPNHPQ
jgi:UDP-3-O-[3-hydroxymyristoyl] glucosamine N-acyltransferase